MDTPARTNWTLVMALLVAGLFSAAQFGKLTLTLPVLQQVYAEGGAFVPVLISIVGMVGIALGAVAGSVVARVGVTRALIGALLAGAALSLVQASLPGIWVFAGLRVLEGVSHLAIVVAAPTLIASVSSEADRPVTMGIWAAFFGIAMAIIAAALPFLLPLGGLPAVFIAHGVGMAVMAVILLPLLPKGLQVEPRPVSYLEEHRIIYSTPKLLIPGAGFVWYTMLYIALLAVLPLALGLPVWVITALPLISIAGTIAGGIIAKRMTPSRLVTIGFALTIAASGLVWVFSAQLWPLFVLFSVMALIPAGSFGAIPYFNESITDRARATGGIAQLGNVGTTLGTPIFVLVFDGAGLGAVCALIAVFCAIGIAATQTLRLRIK
ncbi:putative MFS family arabinose efflux permease [Litoreibacter ponti]|uniref:Putative MFS family arabinose efflux permease n=1 Tax=Litoreibacter ponti TaxID=1510457 RepID=A0A2T6BI67_9RHOB|nr:MFS transporter [Litoreibacter ponti]PTX55757.1 putative MFS family arabinose efflux permease [Litoreibacter ponti]